MSRTSFPARHYLSFLSLDLPPLLATHSLASVSSLVPSYFKTSSKGLGALQNGLSAASQRNFLPWWDFSQLTWSLLLGSNSENKRSKKTKQNTNSQQNKPRVCSSTGWLIVFFFFSFSKKNSGGSFSPSGVTFLMWLHAVPQRDFL